VGSDDNMAFVVNPFELAIRGDGVSIFAKDYLNPADPEQKNLEDRGPGPLRPKAPHRLLLFLDRGDGDPPRLRPVLLLPRPQRYLTEAHRATGEEAGGRRSRQHRSRGHPGQDPGLKTRIYQIEFWGDRVSSKLAFQLTYSHNNNGPQRIEGLEKLKGQADTHHPWPVTYWFGGWDGDLLTGYMAGTLGIPFFAGA